ncbi:MAG: glycerophosphodiester phosphodiesterase, partial [Firmicutes bacterium]|nr:glycerophosphodiester phosphodiesterase [Bacillota bacterium]
MLLDPIIKGRTGNPLLPELKKQIYAHRGYHDKPQIPENSLPAFKRAIENGWGAELDIHILRDGTLAVFHDSDLKRCTGVEGII